MNVRDNALAFRNECEDEQCKHNQTHLFYVDDISYNLPFMLNEEGRGEQCLGCVRNSG